MGKLSTTPTVNFTNCIFDDCKAAIDGQGYPIHWNILHCSLSQFFQGEDIHMHNYNEFHKQHLDGNGNIVYDCHIKYPCSGLLSNSFNGLASDLTTSIEPICNNVIQSTYSKKADPCIVYNDNLSYIPLYDIGGANITVENSIFHKKWNLGTNGNMSLKFPNRDVSKGGVSDNKIIIRKNTFSTFRFTPSQAWFSSINSINYNNTGYAKISDNYIDASVWSADPHNIVEDNYFDYKSGDNLAASAATAPQPNELSLQLNDGTNALSTSYSLSPLEGHKYIQYVNVNTQFYLEASITNAGGSAESYYIIRPNPNTNGVSTTSEAHVISNENYFFDSEEKLNGTTVTKSITYNKPGLYGIDVMGFDAHDYGTAGYDFRASSWQHIPVIVKDDSEEQVLYFNVKDSYKETGTSLTGVMKQAYLNNTAIWSEEITEGGDGWEAVRIDLKGNISGTTTAIKTLLLTDGTPNVLSFGIFMNSNIDASLLKGLFVWVDDVYIKKYDSPTGDNLIKDGSIERILQEGKLETGISENWLWFQDISKTFTGCGETTDGGISSQERKSGEYAIQLEISPLPSCTTYVVAGSGETVVSVGTTVDFTDLLSCNDYWTANTTPPAYGTSAVGFIPFPGIGGVTQGGQYFVPSNISLGSNQTLTLIDCILAFSSDVGIAVSAATAELEIKSTSSTTGSHLFGCANMWNGIVNDNGTLDLFGNINFLPVKIEDAKVAITSNGGNVQLRSVSFDHNGLDIDFDGTTSPFSNQSKINGCEFLCTDGVISKSPFEGVIPNEHVVLNGITNFNFPLGTSGPGAGTLNNFSDAINAVSITNSKVILQRNIFSRIYRRDDGILATDYGRAINIRNNGSATNYSIEIMDNEFNDVNLGINVDNIIGSTLKIYNNTFNNPNYQFDPNPSTVLFYNHRTAIKVQNPIASPAINAEIYGNTITDFRIGIHTLNTPDINIGTDVAGALVAGNTIEFDKTTFPLTNYYGGIWLQNCAGAKVANNSVDNSTENEDLNFRGLDIETSADCFLNCNIIDNIGVAINIYDNCGTTKLRSNEMSHFFTGVWLNGPNGASIDVDQGDATSLESWGNEWNWQAAPSLKVDGANYGLSVGINWYYEGSDVNGNKFSPRPFNANIVSPEAASGTSGSLCTSFFRTTPNRKDNFGPVVGDSAVYTESVDKSRYLATQNSYIAMKNDSSLIYRGDSYDSDFESFFLRMDSSNVAKFQKVRKLAATWPDSAQAINNLITDTNDIEFNSKTFNSLYFSKIINGTPVNSSDSTFLDGLLTGTYITIGESFYYAAAVQFREMHPETSSLRIGTSKPVEVEAIVPHPISIIKIYPNPANNSIKAEIQNGDDKLTLIELYSSIGNLIASQTGNSNLIELNIQSYHEGLYKLRAYTQKGFTDTKTFSIVR
ncbi:MAG: hypothetical protein IPP71_05530 [Bacteroidetes bacterium]|nr:hypothetical protein [Bacteroidota bacterium]